MSNRLSVLQRATAADVRTEPFPHLVIRDALPADLYAELAATFPDPESLGIDSSENNKRWDYPASQARTTTTMTPLWRDFIAYQSSQSFFDEIVSLFGDEIRKIYPRHYPTAESLTGMRAGTRLADDFSSHDILCDALVSGNTPVTEASSVRTTHVDQGEKLYSGLFYMRPETYDAVGGDLTLSRFKPHYDTLDKQLKLFDFSYVPDAHVEHVDTVTYAANTVVLFINSLKSLHGVTVRQASDKSRIFVNLVGEVENHLYTVKKSGGPVRYLAPGETPAPKAANDGWFASLRKRLRA